MKKGSMDIENGRNKDQISRMRKLAKANKCFFCNKNYLELGAEKAIYESDHWYIKKNDYPYEGSKYHYLIATTEHVTKISEINSIVWSDFSQTIQWLEDELGIKGYSIFVRLGDTKYTGATFNHIHFHLISGAKKNNHKKLEDNILVTLGYKNK